MLARATSVGRESRVILSPLDLWRPSVITPPTREDTFADYAEEEDEELDNSESRPAGSCYANKDAFALLLVKCGLH